MVTESGFGFEADYENAFQGVSFEAGKRYYLYQDGKNDFYLAPQISASYLHVDEVDYVTNQNSKIQVDSINSLITRAGVKLGYVFDKRLQFAVKGDWFKEWRGKQHFTMADKTTFGIPIHFSVEPDASWYDVGLTVQANFREDTACYVDVERLFGGMYSNSYRFSAGIRYTF